jgi:hypothetical protein
MSSHLSKLTSLSEARGVIAGASPLGATSTSSDRKTALRAGWLMHTIKRATAAVRSASDEDYRAFGWDRSDLLAKLQWLRQRADHPYAENPIALAITLVPAAYPARRSV